jgi:hypothetical protein
MKLLISALALGFAMALAPAAEAAACSHNTAGCHRHFAYHHHYYSHYAGVVVPPPGYPPPPYYQPWDQPLYGPLGVTIGEENWGNRSVFKLLMQSIGDRPYDD